MSCPLRVLAETRLRWRTHVGLTLRPRAWRLPPHERIRRENELARLRALVAVALFFQGLLLPLTTAPRAFQIGALGLYAIGAAFALAMLCLHREHVGAVGIAGQVMDVAVGVGFLQFGTGPSSLLVVVLALLGAAHRGGARAALRATAGVIALTMTAPFAVHLLGTPAGFNNADYATALAQCGFILLAGIGIGHVTDSADQTRSETEIVALAMNHADVRLGLKHTMAVAFDTIVGHFSARRAVLVIREIANDRVFMWQGAKLSGASAEALRLDRLEPRAFDNYVVIPEAGAWSAVRRAGGGDDIDLIALTLTGSRVDRAPAPLPRSFMSTIGPFEHLMGFVVENPGEWSARLFLIDPSIGGGERLAALELGQRIVRRISPAVDNVSLLHRLRSRSAADERTRIARELHDGIIQSVMGVQIQLHTLAGRLRREEHPLGDEVHRLGGLLHTEVLGLRDMMQQMQPSELAPERLIDTLADLVQRFQYETGIRARFMSQFERIDLSPRACREVTRMIQEALVNVRKHSGAKSVSVRLTCADGVCRLAIDDDGRGFPFTGRLSLNDVEFGRQGPRVIKERVRLLGGELAVESAPNQGARIAISIPMTGHYAIPG
jgi:signal transduction histidine kinase